MNIRPLNNVVGCEVIGLDLFQPMDCETSHALRDAFSANHLLCIRSNPLQPPALSRLARQFGEPQLQLVRRKRDTDAPDVSILDSTYRAAADKPSNLRLVRLSGWHTDDSYFECPAKATMLQALEIPSSGGQTRFCNTRAVYENLDDEFKTRIDGLHAVHGYDTRRTPGTAESLSTAEAKETRDVEHPLVRTHDESGIKAIYFNANRTDRVVGMERTESDQLLDSILEHIKDPKYHYQHDWRVGDILLWDNRCLVHSVNMDFPIGERRLHQRILIAGSKPV